MTTTIPLTLIELPAVPPERDALLIERARQASIAQRLVRLREQVAENERRLAALQRERIAFAAVDAVAQQSAPADDPTKPLVFSDGTVPGPMQREEIDRIGCLHRFERLRELASAKGLNLDIPAQRMQAEAALFSEGNATVFGALTLVEGIHALAREKALSFTELKDGATYAALTQTVGKCRPDLVEREGYPPRDMTAKPSRAELQAKMDGLVATYVDRHGLDPDDARDRAEALGKVAGRNPDLMRSIYHAEQAEAPPTPAATRAKLFAAAVRDVIGDCPRTPDTVRRAHNAVRRARPDLVAPAGGRGRV